MMITIVEREKLRPREGKSFVQGHTDSVTMGLNPGLNDYRVYPLG